MNGGLLCLGVGSQRWLGRRRRPRRELEKGEEPLVPPGPEEEGRWRLAKSLRDVTVSRLLPCRKRESFERRKLYLRG